MALNLIYKTIFIIELHWVLIYSIGGYARIQYNLDVSLILNMILYGVFLYLSIKHIKKKILSVLLIYLLLMLFVSLLHVFSSDANPIIILRDFFKTTFPILIFSIVYIQLKLELLDLNKINKIVVFNIIYLMISYSLSFFGIGSEGYAAGVNEYGESIRMGGAGFIISSNAANGSLLALAALLVFFKNKIIQYTMYAFVFVATIGSLSRTSLIGTNFIIALQVMRGNKKLFLIITGIVIISLYYYIEEILALVEFAINRWKYFIDLYGIEYFLLGGYKRVHFINEYLEVVSSQPLHIVFGNGWDGAAENGLINILQAYGVFGLSNYLFYFYFFTLNLKTIYENNYFVSFTIFLLICISIIGGHLVRSPMFNLFFAILSLSYYIHTRKNV